MKQISLIACIIAFHLYTSPVFAVITHQISNFSRVNDYYSVDVYLTGASADSEYFLQAMFTKEGQPNYLGFTWGQKGDWVKYDGSPEKSFIIENFPGIGNEKTQKILIKPDTEDSGYKGPGEYLLKVKRYTPGGSGTYSENTLTVSLTDEALVQGSETQETPSPTPSPSPSPSPTPSPTPTATPTPSPSPTKTPTPTATKTPTTTRTPTPTNSPTQTATPSPTGTTTMTIISPTSPPDLDEASAAADLEILGLSTSGTPIPTTSPTAQVKGDSSGSTLNKIFIILGLSLAVPAAAVYFFSDRVKIS